MSADLLSLAWSLPFFITNSRLGALTHGFSGFRRALQPLTDAIHPPSLSEPVRSAPTSAQVSLCTLSDTKCHPSLQTAFRPTGPAVTLAPSFQDHPDPNTRSESPG